jgi:nucleotide-binding universal stress UspA family protein
MLHFLVAVDGSEHSQAAVRWVAQMGAHAKHLHCTLLNVQKPIMSGEVSVLAPASVALDERNRSAAEILEHAARVMREHAIPFEIEEQMDDAASAILARAQALRCDGVVMGRRGLGVVRSALLGSVSTEVVGRSSIPVLIVRASESAAPTLTPRVLLAVDGSESSTRAAAFASRLALLCHAEVELVHVAPGLTVASAILGSRERLIEHWSGKRVDEALAGARSMLTRAGVTYTEHVVVGDDAHSAIVGTAMERSCGIVVMGTRGLGPVRGVLMGSVTQRILEEAPSMVAAVALVQ